MRKKWKDIDEFEGYQVSNTGEVRSYINNRHGATLEKPHILKPIKNGKGYDTVCLGRGNRRLVHRLVAAAFIPNPTNLPLVRHLDDDPNNNNADNLAWGTQTDNMQDCVRHGRLVGDTRAAIESTKTPVVAISIADGSRQEFSSMNDAARVLDVWVQHISSVLKGRISQTGGYRFEYAEKEPIQYD